MVISQDLISLVMTYWTSTMSVGRKPTRTEDPDDGRAGHTVSPAFHAFPSWSYLRPIR